MVEQTHFQLILTIIAVGSTVIVAWLFKYKWKAQPEKIFEKNLKSTTKIIFQHLLLLDSYKQSIYDYLENKDLFDRTKPTFRTFPKPIFNDVFRFRSLIRTEIRSLNKISKLGGYITVSQYLAILQYAASAYSFLHTVSKWRTYHWR